MMLSLLWILLLAIAKASTGPSQNVSTENTSYIDVLKQSLARQQWSSDDEPCYETMMRTLNEAQNFTLWAVWAFDSIGLPHGILYGQSHTLGNYDECLAPWRAFDDNEDLPKYKYCLVDVHLTNSLDDGPFSREPEVTIDLYLKKRTYLKRDLSKLKWGICVPRVCQPKSVAKITRAVLQISHLRIMDLTTSIQVQYCHSGHEDGALKQYPLGYYIFILSMTILPIVAAYYTYCVATRKPQPNTFASEFARSFCIKRNYNELIKRRDDEIYSLNFMRNFTMYLTISVHLVSFVLLRTINALDAEDGLKGSASLSVHLDVLTDTFFTLSGLLVLRGLFTDKHKSPLKYIWKRYVRLMTAFALVMAYMIFVLEHTADGPVWGDFATAEAHYCRTNWLHNFLMIYNIVDARNMCIMIAWYVAADFQLSIAVTALFYMYQKNKKTGVKAFWILFSIGIIYPAFATYFQEYYPGPGYSGFEYTNPRLDRQRTEHYIHPTTHMAPFMLGALMGFILYTYKPKEHRKCISQFWSYIAMVVALCLMALPLVGGAYYLDMPHERLVSLDAAVFNGVNRVLWAAGICLVIAVCEYGDIPFLQRSSEWFPLVPLSRLSYEAYLMQYPVMIRLTESIRTLMELDHYHNIIISIGITVVCYISGLFVWMFVEAPVVNINNMLLNKTWKTTEENAVEINVNVKKQE